MGVLDQLAGGQRRSLGSSQAVSEQVLAQPELVGEIVAGILQEEAVVRIRAAHVLYWVAGKRPDVVQPFKQQILEEMAHLPQWEVRQNVCKVLPLLQLDEGDIEAVIELFSGYLDDKSSIVRTCALQGLTDLMRFEPSLRTDIIALLDCASVSGTPAMRARCRKLLKELQKSSPEV